MRWQVEISFIIKDGYDSRTIYVDAYTIEQALEVAKDGLVGQERVMAIAYIGRTED